MSGFRDLGQVFKFEVLVWIKILGFGSSFGV